MKTSRKANPCIEPPELDFPEGCITEAGATSVAKSPDAVALTAGGKVLTSRELDSRANRLARYLRSLGVGADVLMVYACHARGTWVVGASPICYAPRRS